MTLNINKIRPNVLSEKTYQILEEFRKFKDFHRYYFEFDYDWDKIEFLKKKFEEVQDLFEKDIKNFKDSLKKFK
jgi:hypothetical protein